MRSSTSLVGFLPGYSKDKRNIGTSYFCFRQVFLYSTVPMSLSAEHFVILISLSQN